MQSSGSSMSSEIQLNINKGLESDRVSQSRNHDFSIGQVSSSGASFRRLFSFQMDEDVESETVSQAGDIGDRVLSRKRSEGENGTVFPISEELLESYGFWNDKHSNSLNRCPVSPPIEETVTPPLKKQEEKRESPPFEYFSSLVHLAVFGILGVITRYLLQKLFGPNVLGITKHQQILYLDLPSNMVGSFLMGWFGVVFKSDISRLSDQLAIGLSTGYLGSLTTFSSWNQEMLELSSKGHWAEAITCLVLGLIACAYSINFGVETAKGLKNAIKVSTTTNTWSKKHHLIALISFSLIWGGFLGTSVVLESKEFKHGSSAAQLWLGCLVAPLGVWVRWWLARLNGGGLGKVGRCKWLPFGTLIANVLAACIMAALATVKKAVNTKNCDTIATGIQLGLLGCLSTVSTFMAEFNAMRNSAHSRRAHIYAAITIGFSFALGTLIYSVPVWIKDYK